MNENTFIDIWNECCEFNIEQKPEEYRQLLELLESKCNKGAVLEIGSNYGGTTVGFCRMFSKVITIDIKHDPNFDKLKSRYSGYQYVLGDSKSDDMLQYIKSLGIKFDFIFIDGDHSYEGVKSDYEKYKQFLAHDGYMAFHDIVYSQENVENNARVDKLWNELLETYTSDRYEFVSPSKTHNYPTNQLFYTYVGQRPYSSWGGIGVLKNTPIGVFCHNYLANGWMDIVQSQLSKLFDSGLYKRADKILYGVLPTDEMSYSAFLAMIRLKDVDRKIEICRYSKNMYEYPTLIHLQNYCANNPNAYVLYYHAKGTSRKYDNNIESWRECLEYFNIELWKRPINDLSSGNHDVCGALYVTSFKFLDKELNNYYSGNFWWASAKYTNTLPNLSARMLESNMDRDIPERWIGYGAHRWINYYNENVSSWYEHYFDPNIYKNRK